MDASLVDPLAGTADGPPTNPTAPPRPSRTAPSGPPAAIRSATAAAETLASGCTADTFSSQTKKITKRDLCRSFSPFSSPGQTTAADVYAQHALARRRSPATPHPYLRAIRRSRRRHRPYPRRYRHCQMKRHPSQRLPLPFHQRDQNCRSVCRQCPETATRSTHARAVSYEPDDWSTGLGNNGIGVWQDEPHPFGNATTTTEYAGTLTVNDAPVAAEKIFWVVTGPSRFAPADVYP